MMNFSAHEKLSSNPLGKERMLVIASVAAGTAAAILNLSRPILFGKIVNGVLDVKQKSGLILLVALFAATWIGSWVIGL